VESLAESVQGVQGVQEVQEVGFRRFRVQEVHQVWFRRFRVPRFIGFGAVQNVCEPLEP
jgi:hypothetical protein